MKGDFTRDTFDPANHYSRVLLQQGRVALDADWNEQSAIVLHFLRALARDLIGPHGGSQTGFSIVTKKKDIVGLDPDLDRDRLAELEKAMNNNGDFVINPGHYYVDGILIENEKPMLYTDQSWVDSTSLDALKGQPYLIYLDVWERHITYLEDGRIREVALGGPDTATRAQIIWQVKVFRDGKVLPPCKAVDNFPPAGTGLLRARARQDSQQSELCVIPPEARYRGPENQLYRVEIHKAGKAGGDQGATFKWSRENGAVVFPIRDVSVDASGKQTSVTLGNLGPDARLGLREGDCVEVLDETYVLENRADPLLRIAKIDREQMRLTIDGTTKVTKAGRNTILRRWDGTQPVQENSSVSQGWIGLEDGVEIWFLAGKEYQTGDYWLIPARTATGDVIWPRVTSGGAEIPAAMSPNGPRHHYAPLAQRAGGATAALSECRCTINKLVTCPPGP